MNKKFYTPLLIASLIFVACNTTNPEPAKEVQEIKESSKVEVVKEESVQKGVQEKSSKVAEDTSPKEASTVISGVKYAQKPMVQEQGLFHIKSFLGTLQPTLESAMQDGGPTVGFGVCASLAMQMTDDYNALTTDTKIRRTALKYRNPKNKPDEIDKKVMNELIRRGDFKPVTIDVGDKYRVYKPLPTKTECLVCHGSVTDIPKKVADMNKRQYPKDLAIDFVKGEFRGVVIAEILK